MVVIRGAVDVARMENGRDDCLKPQFVGLDSLTLGRSGERIVLCVERWTQVM
jgi:hypothetical protein